MTITWSLYLLQAPKTPKTFLRSADLQDLTKTSMQATVATATTLKEPTKVLISDTQWCRVHRRKMLTTGCHSQDPYFRKERWKTWRVGISSKILDKRLLESISHRFPRDRSWSPRREKSCKLRANLRNNRELQSRKWRRWRRKWPSCKEERCKSTMATTEFLAKLYQN